MTQRNIKKEIKYLISHFYPEEKLKQYQAVLQEVETKKREIVSAFNQTEQAKYLMAQGVRVGLDNYSHSMPRLDSAYMCVVVEMSGDDGTKPQAYIDTPLLNTLLHGKLLSEKEKRQLLEERGILRASDGAPSASASISKGDGI